MLTPLVTTTFAPSQQLSPMRVGPLLSNPCQVIGFSGSSKRWRGVGHEAAVGEHAVIADLDQLVRGHHHAFVQERAGADPHARATRRGDPDARLEQRPRPDLQAALAQRLEHVAVHRPAHEGLAAHELPVDLRAVPGQRVALIPAPLLRPQPRLRSQIASAASAPMSAPRRRRLARVGGCLAAARLRVVLPALPERSGGRRRSRPGKLPVWEDGSAATSSGVPTAIARPPSSPPSGPMSISRSADLITSRLCSITTTLLPASTSRCSTSSRRCTSAKCRPVVGSSRM